MTRSLLFIASHLRPSHLQPVPISSFGRTIPLIVPHFSHHLQHRLLHRLRQTIVNTSIGWVVRTGSHGRTGVGHARVMVPRGSQGVPQAQSESATCQGSRYHCGGREGEYRHLHRDSYQSPIRTLGRIYFCDRRRGASYTRRITPDHSPHTTILTFPISHPRRLPAQYHPQYTNSQHPQRQLASSIEYRKDGA